MVHRVPAVVTESTTPEPLTELGGPARDPSPYRRALLGWAMASRNRDLVRRLTAAATPKESPQITQNTQKLTCSRRRKSAEPNLVAADGNRRTSKKLASHRRKSVEEVASSCPAAVAAPEGGAENSESPGAPPDGGGYRIRFPTCRIAGFRRADDTTLEISACVRGSQLAASRCVGGDRGKAGKFACRSARRPEGCDPAESEVCATMRQGRRASS